MNQVELEDLARKAGATQYAKPRSYFWRFHIDDLNYLVSFVRSAKFDLNKADSEDHVYIAGYWIYKEKQVFIGFVEPSPIRRRLIKWLLGYTWVPN